MKPIDSALDQLMQAKAARDVVRQCVLRALRAGGTAEEIAGLLKADELAAKNMAAAQHAYDQIPDFTL